MKWNHHLYLETVCTFLKILAFPTTGCIFQLMQTFLIKFHLTPPHAAIVKNLKSCIFQVIMFRIKEIGAKCRIKDIHSWG